MVILLVSMNSRSCCSRHRRKRVPDEVAARGTAGARIAKLNEREPIQRCRNHTQGAAAARQFAEFRLRWQCLAS
jgi:hypothetical protein